MFCAFRPFVLACVMASCSAEEAQQEEMEPRFGNADPEFELGSAQHPPESLGAYTCEALQPLALSTVPTRHSLRAEFGPPDSIRLVAQPNRHVPDREDSWFTVFYPGLWASGVRPGGSQRDLIDRVHVSDNRYLKDPSIGIGADIRDVQRATAAVWFHGSQGFEADCGYEVPQGAIVEVEGALVRSVAFTYYVD
jgi:hypothetical protein